MKKEADKAKSSEEIQLGIPVIDFEAASETLQELCQEGKYQIFLFRGSLIKFVGEIDEFRLRLGKKLGQDIADRKRVAGCLQELTIFLQVCIATTTQASAIRIFERQVYEDDFAKAKKDHEQTENLRHIIKQKIGVVISKLLSSALKERSKRLESVIGPILEEIDIEIISRRRSLANDVDIDTPFLRIRLLHTMGGKHEFPYLMPPWILDPPSAQASFDLECDETDIDFLIRRLVQAKELLSKAIEDKLKVTKALEATETSNQDEPQ